MKLVRLLVIAAAVIMPFALIAWLDLIREQRIEAECLRLGGSIINTKDNAQLCIANSAILRPGAGHDQ